MGQLDAALDIIDRIGRLQQRIRELDESKEINPRHLDIVLSEKGTKAFDTECKRQQGLRKLKKLTALNKYETLYKQATAILARSEAGGEKTKNRVGIQP